MRFFLMVVAAAASLAAVAPAARAQGEFPLKYVPAEENDPLTSMGMSYMGGMPQKPPQIKALPQGLSDNVRYFAMAVGGKRLWAVLDASSPPKLYVDLAGKGDLSAAEPIDGKAAGSQCSYGPVDLTMGEGASAVTAKVVFVSVANNQILGARAGGYVAGMAKLDGQTYRVAVLDRNLDGRCDPAMGEDGTAASLVLMSDTGMHSLNGAGGKWQVPEGNYTCENLSIAKAGADRKECLLSGSDPGPLAKFEVRGGETTTIEIGPPLALKVDATAAGQGVISLEASLAGKGGETYSLAIRKGAVQPTPPKIKIFDASGKVLAEGNLEYG
jgi:hypothetical protein